MHLIFQETGNKLNKIINFKPLELSLYTSNHSFAFKVLESNTTKILQEKLVNFEPSQSANLFQINKILAWNDLLNKEWTKVSIFANEKDFTLIPSNLFNKENSNLYLNFISDKMDAKTFISDSTLGIYEILFKSNLKSLPHLKLLYPESRTLHIINDLEGLFQAKSGVFAISTPKSLISLYKLNGELKHAASFQIENEMDIAYFILSIFEHYELDQESMPLTYISSRTEVENTVKELGKYIGNLEFKSELVFA